MGIIDLTKDLENLVAGHYSDARGAVVRGDHTELTMVNFSVGEGAREHTHTEEQFLVVLKGKIRVKAAGEYCDVSEGQAYFFPSSVPHSTEALEDTRAISFKNLVNPSYTATDTAM